MAYLSPEEVEQEHLQAMGPSLGPFYHLLYNDVMWLHAKWQEYRKLFASPESVSLLNSVAGFCFLVTQNAMWWDVLLHLTRLVDSPTSLGRADKANVTLQALPVAIPDSSLALMVFGEVEEVKRRCAFAIDWRNRRIAHHDLALALQSPAAVPLADASRNSVEAALTSIRAALGLVHSHYLKMEPGFEYFIAPLGDADSLLHHLRRSPGLEPSE
jgi:hypothetical protein